MADKSPRQSMTKKTGRTVKEKRADKKLKAAGQDHVVIVPAKKH